MHPLYEEFAGYLESEDKKKCLDFVNEKLIGGTLDVLTLYAEVLTPALNRIDCDADPDECVWREHVKSSIVRTIIENCYGFVLDERKKRLGDRQGPGERVMVVCPPEELHELGARMVADAFTIHGFDVTFVGANTPRAAFLSAVESLAPRYVALSVTNHYNLVAAAKTVREVRTSAKEPVEIIAGGRAFARNPEFAREMGADIVMHTFGDIAKLAGGG